MQEKNPGVNYTGMASLLKGLMIIRNIPVIHGWWMTPLLTKKEAFNSIL